MSTEGNNEKASPSLNNGRLSWLKPKPSDKLDSVSSPEKPPTPDLHITAPAEDEPKPVSFFTLFRSVPVSFHVSTLHCSPQVLYSHRAYHQCPFSYRRSGRRCRPGVYLNFFFLMRAMLID